MGEISQIIDAKVGVWVKFKNIQEVLDENKVNSEKQNDTKKR